MVQITVECGKGVQIPIKESSAVKFPESAELFQEGFAVGLPKPAVCDGQVDEFLHPLKGLFGVVATAFGEPFCGTISFAPNIGHLFCKRHISPCSVAEVVVLHYSTNCDTMDFICSLTSGSSTSRLRLPCQERILIKESNSMKSSPVSSGYRLNPQRLSCSDPFSSNIDSKSAWSSASTARRPFFTSATHLIISTKVLDANSLSCSLDIFSVRIFINRNFLQKYKFLLNNRRINYSIVRQ